MSKPGKSVRVDAFVRQQLDYLSLEIGKKLKADVIAIYGPLQYGAEDKLVTALESRTKKLPHIAIVLETDGGIIEVVERMVHAIRHHYSEVTMVIPGMAMSAGTVFAMAGDKIMMDYSSCLGPIDPQIVREDKLVPAMSYLVQFERMKKKRKLTAAEMVLLDHLDFAELHSFEQAQELSNSLLKKWLATYKFKNWTLTESRKKKVTQKMRQRRALDIAKALADQERWHSHGRPIGMEILRNDLKLKIDDFGQDAKLETPIRSYHQLLSDYKFKTDAYHFTHTNGLLI